MDPRHSPFASLTHEVEDDDSEEYSPQGHQRPICDCPDRRRGDERLPPYTQSSPYLIASDTASARLRGASYARIGSAKTIPDQWVDTQSGFTLERSLNCFGRPLNRFRRSLNHILSRKSPNEGRSPPCGGDGRQARGGAKKGPISAIPAPASSAVRPNGSRRPGSSTRRSTLPPSVLPDISPARGEIARHHGLRQSPGLALPEPRRCGALRSGPSVKAIFSLPAGRRKTAAPLQI